MCLLWITALMLLPLKGKSSQYNQIFELRGINY